jgi:maleate cis-trans isomerase
VCLASRFPQAVNQQLADYLASDGIQVVGATTRDVSLEDARALTVEGGMEMMLELGREAALAFPDAEAILVPGGAALSLHVPAALEAEFGKPALTNLTAEIWNGLIRPGLAPSVSGWGQLLANSPRAV